MLRSVEIRPAKNLAQDCHGFPDARRFAVTQVFPQADILGAIAVLEQFFLRPADQRGYEHTCEGQVVKRLCRKPDGCHQILDGERISQSQSVHACDGYAPAVKTRYYERSQIAPFAHEYHDIPRPSPPRCTILASIFHQGKARIHPVSNLLRYTVGQFTIVTSQPAFVDLAFFHAAIGVDQVPEGHHAGTGLTFVLFCFSIETQSFAADRGNGAVDEIENIVCGAEALTEPVFAQIAWIRPSSQVGSRVSCFPHAFGETIPGVPEILRAGALETEDCLLEIADGENRAHSIPTRALAAEEIVGQSLYDLPLRPIGILRFIDEDMVETAIQLVADPVSHCRVRKQVGGTGNKIVEIDKPFARLGRLPLKSKCAASRELGHKKIGEVKQRTTLRD